MAERHTDSLEWPNGEGFTPCTPEYRATMEERDAILDPFGSINLDDLSPEDYQRWNVLDNELMGMQLDGHLGQSERI